MSLHLNWREISALVELFRSQGPGGSGAASSALFVDRVVIPERSRFPKGYLKGEWALRLSSRKSEQVFLFSVRPNKTYFAFLDPKRAKALKNSPKATHSVFDLALSKYVRGSKFLSFEALPRERVIVLWFSGEETSERSPERLGLVLSLIPASPEALLIRAPSDQIEYKYDYPVLARSRNLKNDSSYQFPDGMKAPDDLPLRVDRIGSSETFLNWIEADTDLEAFETRKRFLEKTLKEQLKQATQRVRQSQTTLKEAQAEADWDRLGTALKAVIHEEPPVIKDPISGAQVRVIVDFAAEVPGTLLTVPSDPKLSLKEQVEKFFQMSKRKARRILEAGARRSGFQEAQLRFQGSLAELEKNSSTAEILDWKALEQLERSLGVVPSPALAPAGGGKKNQGAGAWLGKTFITKEGLPIWIGRSRDENLELTFKHSRGNDLWMHVKGRPGAHTLIPLRDRKSASLDTLLDAAVLTVYYSGGEKWGKTEVDYTFKKHVKRIKDSKEASYTHNKTLVVEPDPVRLKRLLPKGD
ncbi:MAG: DUF814 domain-containing protein [Methylotenera sp.]|nr:DUF814 domain-containing protein [Oligoflexia bacterium]